jgi:hypothetical protein
MTDPPEQLSENTPWCPAGKTIQAGYPSDEKPDTGLGEKMFSARLKVS